MLALDVEKLYAEEAKEKQRDHGGTAPGKAKSLVPDPAQVITEPKNKTAIAIELDTEYQKKATTRAAKAVGVGSTAVKQAKRVEQVRADKKGGCHTSLDT